MQPWKLLALAIIATLFYQPIIRLIAFGLNHQLISNVFNTKILGITWFTLWQAALSTLIALLLATPSAYALYRIRFPGSHLIAAAIATPFILPTIVVAIALQAFWHNSSAFAVIVANVFMNYGFATRIIGSAWQGIDNSIEEAAQLDGASEVKKFFAITRFELKGAYLSAGFLTFLYCAANFGLMLVIGGGKLASLETSIYLSVSEILNLPRAAALVLVQCAITLLALFFIYRTRMAYPFFTGSNRVLPAKRRDIPAICVSLVIALSLIAAPLCALIMKSLHATTGFGLRNYGNLLTRGARATLSISLGQAGLNSLRNAAISALIAMVTGLFVASNERSRILIALYRLPVGISSVALGLGYLVTFNAGIFPLRNSWLITPIAQSLLLIPLVIQVVLPAQAALNEDFAQLARTDGLHNLEYWWYIQRPLLKGPIMVALGYVVIVSIGEFGTANFLTYGDQATLPTVLYQLISRPGALNYGMAMAASSLLIVLVFAITSLIDYITREQELV